MQDMAAKRPGSQIVPIIGVSASRPLSKSPLKLLQVLQLFEFPFPEV